MIFRLLFRLFLQRAYQWRPRQRESETAPILVKQDRWLTLGMREKHRLSGWVLAIATVLAGSLALGWHYSQRLSHGEVASADRANLQLQVLSSKTWPLVVYLQGEGLPPPDARPTGSKTGRIESIDGRFSPAFQVLPASDTLEIVNSDSIAHSTHVFNRGETIFNVGLPLPGVTVNKTLTGTGIYSVRCDLHPSMQAWLFAPPSRYYAVLHEPDSVNFPDLTPGEYVLHLWQADGAEHLRVINLIAGKTTTLHLGSESTKATTDSTK